MIFSVEKDIDFQLILFLHLNFISSQSQMDVDSGIETMEVDDSDMKFEIKRRRVYAFNNWYFRSKFKFDSLSYYVVSDCS